MYRIGIDVGGTFTDVTLLNSETGAYYTYKLSSTLHDQSEAIANGTKETLALYGVPVEQLEYFGHGTTVATNMIIERKGAKTALITTKGFRDLLEIGRQTRPSLYDIMEDKPETLVRRALRREVDERTMADGTILRKVNRDEVLRVLSQLKEKGVESLAVCFLFSFLNPENERIVEQCIKETWPEVYCSVSSTILPEFREFERLSTTVINSYLGPRMKMYIHHLQDRIRQVGVRVEPYITQSNGGVMSISSTIQTPVQTALSGPSAGLWAPFTLPRRLVSWTSSPMIWGNQYRCLAGKGWNCGIHYQAQGVWPALRCAHDRCPRGRRRRRLHRPHRQRGRTEGGARERGRQSRAGSL